MIVFLICFAALAAALLVSAFVFCRPQIEVPKRRDEVQQMFWSNVTPTTTRTVSYRDKNGDEVTLSQTNDGPWKLRVKGKEVNLTDKDQIKVIETLKDAKADNIQEASEQFTKDMEDWHAQIEKNLFEIPPVPQMKISSPNLSCLIDVVDEIRRTK